MMSRWWQPTPYMQEVRMDLVLAIATIEDTLME